MYFVVVKEGLPLKGFDMPSSASKRLKTVKEQFFLVAVLSTSASNKSTNMVPQKKSGIKKRTEFCKTLKRHTFN